MLKKRIGKKNIVRKIAKKAKKYMGGDTRHFAVTYIMCPIHRVRYPKGSSCPEC